MTAAKPCYQVDAHEGYTVVKLEANLDFTNCKVFDAQVDEISANRYVVVDCDGLPEIPKDWLRSLLKLHLNTKRDGKFLKLIRVSSVLRNALVREGIDTTFRFAKDLRDALQETGLAPKRTLDTEFINPFLNATIHVLRVQAQIEATPGQIYMKKPRDAMMTGDISGVIGIVSDSFDGSVVISFPEATFLKVISNMLGEEYKKIDQEIVDGAGELTNMIFGQAKIVLNEKGCGIKTAIPTVVSGKDHTLSALTKGPVVVIPFTTLHGKFFVEIGLSN
jgi:chemotaxis protein CheX